MPRRVSDNSARTAPDHLAQQPIKDAAQPTEAAGTGCFLKLVLIPMVIVAICVAIWFVFGLLAHVGSDPADLVLDLKKGKDIRWQKALTLANLLRSPEFGSLKRDPQVAADLAGVLQSQIEAGAMDAESIKLRVFLCRALGEFEAPVVARALTQAVRAERDVAEVEVRRSAMEAIAVLATNVGPAKVAEDQRLMEAVLAATKEQGEGAAAKKRRDDLRTTAAFTLGVIGGERAIERLELLLSDPCPNARYNAATGLARHGEIVAIPVLLEMLDPNNRSAVLFETSDEAKVWKRALVVTNAMRATRQLAEKNRSADLRRLNDALENVVHSDLEPRVRSEARETLHALNSLQAR